MSAPDSFSRRLQQAGKAIRPISEHTMRWTLVTFAVLVALLEVDQVWGGKLYGIWGWVWGSLLTSKSVVFMLGMLTYHMLLRHRRQKHESGIRNSVFKHATLTMDLDELEGEARKMGVQLRLKDDPRIAAMQSDPGTRASQELRPFLEKSPSAQTQLQSVPEKPKE